MLQGEVKEYTFINRRTEQVVSLASLPELD
jgi:hypothetical protein